MKKRRVGGLEEAGERAECRVKEGQGDWREIRKEKDGNLREDRSRKKIETRNKAKEKNGEDRSGSW